MKKKISILIAIALLIICFVFSVYAAETTSEDIGNAYAILRDKDGNVVENLEVDVSVSKISTSPATGTTYAVTYTTREVKGDSSASYLDGVTASGTITWNDIAGTTNLLVNVSGNWTTGSRTISNRTVMYSATAPDGSTLDSYTQNPVKNEFTYSEPNCTGFQFYLHTYAVIDATGNTIELHAWSKASTT